MIGINGDRKNVDDEVVVWSPGMFRIGGLKTLPTYVKWQKGANQGWATCFFRVRHSYYFGFIILFYGSFVS
jgi:hypothetical protein